VIAYSVGNSFNQHRSLLFNDDLTGRLSRSIDGKYVIAVDADSRHAVGDTADCDAVTGVLVIDGGRDGVHVVPTVEQGLTPQSSCKVKSSVEVTLRSRTVAKVGNGDAVLVVDAELVAGTSGLGHLGAKGR